MRPVTGILLKLGAVCVFVAMQAIVKLAAAKGVPLGEIVFFRSLFAMPVIVLWLATRGELRSGLKAKNPLGHVWRGVVGTGAMTLGFAAVSLLPLPEATALGYAAPLLVVIFAAMFLHEEVRAFRLSAVGMGLIGVLVVLSPRLGGLGEGDATREMLGVIVALFGAVFTALAQVQVRTLVATESTAAIVFWFSVTATLLALVTAFWGWVMPSPGIFALLIAGGLAGGVGQILLTSSYRYADASVVAPFDYASMLLAIIVGYSLFGEVPTPRTLIGGGIVIVAGVLIIWRERRLGIERAKQRKAGTPQA